MSYKRLEKTIDADLWGVKRRGTDGITITVAHTTKGSKHKTRHIQNINLSLCAMRRMGGEFHAIMDELSNEWHSTKRVLSGE